MIWEVVGFYLGQLCANIVLTCSPEVIILGGGVMKRKVIYHFILKNFTETLKGYLSHPKLESTYLCYKSHIYLEILSLDPELFIKVSAIEDVGLKGAMVL